MAVRGCGAIPSLRDVQAASDAKAHRTGTTVAASPAVAKEGSGAGCAHCVLTAPGNKVQPSRLRRQGPPTTRWVLPSEHARTLGPARVRPTSKRAMPYTGCAGPCAAPGPSGQGPPPCQAPPPVKVLTVILLTALALLTSGAQAEPNTTGSVVQEAALTNGAFMDRSVGAFLSRHGGTDTTALRYLYKKLVDPKFGTSNKDMYPASLMMGRPAARDPLMGHLPFIAQDPLMGHPPFNEASEGVTYIPDPLQGPGRGTLQ